MESNPKRWMLKGITAVVILTFLLIVSSKDAFCEEKAKPSGMMQNQYVHVDVYKVPKPADMPVELKYPTRLKSIQSVEIVARVAGVLEEKYYKEGQFVKKGDILYLIEPDIYKAQVDAAKAQLQSAIAALHKAERDWKRIKALYKANATSQQARDAALSAYEIAKANVERAKANLETAQINLNYTKVKATISGITGLKDVDVGSYVVNGTRLVRITKIDPIYAEFSIPDIDAIKEKYNIKNGKWSKATKGELKAYLEINGKKYNQEGFVNFIDINIDPQTSTVKARAIFKNPDRLLMPGEFARIIIKGLVRKNTILVPQKAVLQNPLGMIVFVANKGKAEIRPIKISETSGKYFVVERGLKAGDMVIVNNFFKIKPGVPVKIDKIINKGAANVF